MPAFFNIEIPEYTALHRAAAKYALILDMICTLTVVRYPRWFGWAGVLSMAVFRFPLWFSRRTSFWKLMGSGKNGTFDKRPDWLQWAALVVWSEESGVGRYENFSFFKYWWRFFRCEVWTLDLRPIEGHGKWDGEACFGELPKQA